MQLKFVISLSNYHCHRATWQRIHPDPAKKERMASRGEIPRPEKISACPHLPVRARANEPAGSSAPPESSTLNAPTSQSRSPEKSSSSRASGSFYWQEETASLLYSLHRFLFTVMLANAIIPLWVLPIEASASGSYCSSQPLCWML